MRYLYRLIILSCLLFSSSAYALEFFFDVLYWRPTEAVDWVLSNNLNATNQNITYKTISFGFEPGFRVGVGYECDWDTKFYYTRYYTKATDSARGNLTSAFLGGKLAQTVPTNPTNFFYQTGQINFTIDYNIFDWDVGKRFYPNELLMLHPLVGLRGGWINQTTNSSFQGLHSVTENIKNNFSGIGPKVGIEGKVTFLRKDDYHFNLIANFTTAYLAGHWTINDILNDNAPRTIKIDVASRNFGALAMQGLLGLNLDYKRFSMNLSYEINDWFNQCQIFDDATGPHNNDLILQGVTLSLSYNF